MTICDVLSVISIGDNTAVVVDGSSVLFRNGMEVLDEYGNSFEILSVGVDTMTHAEEIMNKTSLLIKGCFNSDVLFVNERF